jgi:hypothetical protein
VKKLLRGEFTSIFTPLIDEFASGKNIDKRKSDKDIKVKTEPKEVEDIELIDSVSSSDGSDIIGDKLVPLFPQDAMALPIHMRLPFIHLGDAIVVVIQRECDRMRKKYCQNNNDNYVSLKEEYVWDAITWLSHSSNNNILLVYDLRLILCLLKIGVELKTPYIALTESQFKYCKKLQFKLSKVLQLQYFQTNLRKKLILIEKKHQSNDNINEDQYSSDGILSILLQCELLISHISRVLTVNKNIISSDQQARQSIVYTLILCYRLYHSLNLLADHHSASSVSSSSSHSSASSSIAAQ